MALKARLQPAACAKRKWSHSWVFVQAVAYPADTVRRRMQLNGSIGQQQIMYKGYLDCVRSMAQTEGLQSFYRGFTVSCIRTAPSAAVQASAFLLPLTV